MTKWTLFLYYCMFCKRNNIPGKTYDEFFKDRELVAEIGKSYYRFVTSN